MLRICSEQEFRQYANAMYQLAVDPTKAGYPSYSDKIKTKEMFLERALAAFSRDTEEILLFEHNGVVEGCIHYYWIPEDNYLATTGFNINCHTEEALREFLAWVEARFSGYDLFLGYSRKNTQAVRFLSAHGFDCIESSYNNTALLTQYEPAPVHDTILPITKDNYELFRRLHRQVEGTMYWNSDRLEAALDEWKIFVKTEDTETLGAVYYRTDDDGWFEIYGIEYKDNAYDASLFRDLLRTALNTAKEMGCVYMTFFCEETEQNIATQNGFECVDAYVCYRKHLT